MGPTANSLGPGVILGGGGILWGGAIRQIIRYLRYFPKEHHTVERFQAINETNSANDNGVKHYLLREVW